MTKSVDRVKTLHPAGKCGVNIERAKYVAMRRALLAVVPRRPGGVAFRELADLVRPRLAASAFPPTASVTWYVAAVKQDLEARGLIEQVPGAKPQLLRRTSSKHG